MPGGDRTGPMGTGAMTGRGMGYCNGRLSNMMYLGGGRFTRGCGMGFGGHGRRNRFYATGLPGWARTDADVQNESGTEMDALKQQAKVLQSSLEQINHRIEQLEKE